jgi:hypothetical protein
MDVVHGTDIRVRIQRFNEDEQALPIRSSNSTLLAPVTTRSSFQHHLQSSWSYAKGLCGSCHGGSLANAARPSLSIPRSTRSQPSSPPYSLASREKGAEGGLRVSFVLSPTVRTHTRDAAEPPSGRTDVGSVTGERVRLAVAFA